MARVSVPSDTDPLITRYRGYSEQPHAPLPDETGHFGNPYFRFTVLFAFLVVVTATLPPWLAYVTPHYAPFVFSAISVFFGVEWVVIALCAVRNYRKLDFAPVAAWEESLALRSRRFKHLVIVPCYLDPLDVLHNCLDTLVYQSATEDLVVTVTFERKTPDLEQKITSVRNAFSDKFGDFLIVVHDLQSSKEIPGGCSNKNFALRETYKYVSKQHGNAFHTTRYTITTCDTDSRFHPRYFEVLEAAYNAENPREDVAVKMNVWQPSLFYNWNLDERPFFNRVTCIMRTMMMLGGLISFNINPMSIFSYPLELGYSAGFINARYSVDDIIAKVRWMCVTNSSVPVRLLPVIVISGPTIGTTFWEEVNEWGRQCRRWIVGASESFHYFIIHWRGRPFLTGISWFFIFFQYYGALLCCAGIFQILAAVPYPYMEQDQALQLPGTSASLSLRYCGVVSLGLQLFAFGIGFAIDAFGTMRLGLEEDISPLRNLIHWLSSPLVLLTYSLIAFVSIVRFVFEGKKMAGHDMAAKEGLAVETRHNDVKQINRVQDGALLRDSFISSKVQPSHTHGPHSTATSQVAFTSSCSVPPAPGTAEADPHEQGTQILSVNSE